MLEIKENIDLKMMTSFRIGGKASFYAEIKNKEELREAYSFVKEKNIPFFILGGGTNILISDNGFNGLVIKIKMNNISVENNLITLQAGVPLIKLINTASENGLTGIEYLAGIPGTVGGAIRGNAGAFGSEMGSFVKSITYFDFNSGKEIIVDGNICDFSYRSSIFKKNRNMLILETEISLQKGDIKEIKDKVFETIEKRSEKNLGSLKSAGSYFMNPKIENYKLIDEFEKEKNTKSRNGVLPAGWFIEKANLGGKKIGEAMVSDIHSNYIVNTGNATAEDVIILASFIKQQVRDNFNVQLQEEVECVGF